MKFGHAERIFLGATGLLGYGTGAALFAVNRWVRVSTAIGEQHHPAEPVVRMLHGVLGYGLVLALGYVLRGHVVPGLRSSAPRRVPSGTAMLIVFALLLVTAWVTLYGGESEWTSTAALAHGLVGLGAPALIGMHAVRCFRGSRHGPRRPGRIARA